MAISPALTLLDVIQAVPETRNGEADCPTRRHGGGDDPGGDHVHGIRSLPAPTCGEKERWSMQLVSIGECLAFFFSITVLLYLWIQ